MEYPIKQNSPEWLVWRKTHIGASDAPIILRESPWMKPIELYNQKISDEIVELDNFAVNRGKALEPYALEAVSKELGIELQPKVFVSDEIDYMAASIDGISEDGKTVVEIKCPGEKTMDLARQGIIPKHYEIQMHHQMKVLGVDSIFYYCYDGQDGVLMMCYRNEALISKIVEAEAYFYDCMKTKTPPDFKVLDTNVEWAEWAALWKDLQEEKSLLEKKEAECKEKLIEIAGEPAFGCGVRLSQVERKGAVQYKKIPELAKIDLEKFRAPGSKYWKLQTV